MEFELINPILPYLWANVVIVQGTSTENLLLKDYPISYGFPLGVLRFSLTRTRMKTGNSRSQKGSLKTKRSLEHCWGKSHSARRKDPACSFSKEGGVVTFSRKWKMLTNLKSQKRTESMFTTTLTKRPDTGEQIASLLSIGRRYDCYQPAAGKWRHHTPWRKSSAGTTKLLGNSYPHREHWNSCWKSVSFGQVIKQML